MEQNRTPKGIPGAGQFAAALHPEADVQLRRKTRTVQIAEGDSETFPELTDDVIENLTVSRSLDEDGGGYWIESSKTVDIAALVNDADPRLHGEHLDRWLDRNQPVIEDFLAHRYQAGVSVEDAWDEVDLECGTRVTDEVLTEDRIVSAAWNDTRTVQLHNESDHGTFGSENLGRLICERVERCAVLNEPYRSRGTGLRLAGDPDRLQRIIDQSRSSRLPDEAAVAIAVHAGSLRNAKGVIMCPEASRLATRGYLDARIADQELTAARAANEKSIRPDHRLEEQLTALQSWIRDVGGSR